MIEKNKNESNFGKSFDYELYHKITHMTAKVVKVYDYSGFEGLVTGVYPLLKEVGQILSG